MRTEAIDPPGITWLRVSPKYVTVRLASWALANLIVVRPAVRFPWSLSSTAWWQPFPLWLAVAIPAVMLVLALWRLLLIPRQVRAIGYAEREDDLLIRRGIFFQRTLVVPYGRMQYVDIGAGPVERGAGPVHAETAHRLRRHQRGNPGPARRGRRAAPRAALRPRRSPAGRAVTGSP